MTKPAKQPEPVNTPTAEQVQQAVERLRDWVGNKTVMFGVFDLRTVLDALAAAERERDEAQKQEEANNTLANHTCFSYLRDVAASQAREAKLRAALRLLKRHADLYLACGDGGWFDDPADDIKSTVDVALAESSDTTALREFGERCAREALAEWDKEWEFAETHAAAIVARVLGEKR